MLCFEKGLLRLAFADADIVGHLVLDPEPQNPQIQTNPFYSQFVAPSDTTQCSYRVTQLCPLAVMFVDASSASMSILSARPALTIEPCEF